VQQTIRQNNMSRGTYHRMTAASGVWCGAGGGGSYGG